MKQITTIGLDLAKQVFQIHGADAEGSPIVNRKLRRAEVLRFFEKQPACLVGIEACGSWHYWAREIAALGHDVRLIPPAYVKPFVMRGKTDAADAEAISEAVTRKTMRFVPIKSAEQQAAAMVMKTRSLLVRQQTQAINALRAHLSELGIIAAIGTTKVAGLIEIVRDPTDARLPKAARFRPDTIYLSTGGGWSPATDMAVRALAARPGVRLIAATDNNSQGDRYAVRLEAAASEADCGFERLRPKEVDWNAELKEKGAR